MRRAVARRATPLSRLLGASASPARVRVTALDVFQLARAKWLAGERIDIAGIAQQLGVARATVFRWVGSREQLYGEVISELFAATLAKARRAARGAGPDRAADVTARLLRALVAAAPLRRFVQQDPEFALRVLMSRGSPVEQRCTAAVRGLLEEEIAAGRLRPAMELDALAYIVVRIGESFLYRDVISGDAPDVEAATTAIRILYAAGRPRGKAAPR